MAATKEDSQPRPNIVYILAEAMGFGDLGRNDPASKIPTPNLDRLAVAGLLRNHGCQTAFIGKWPGAGVARRSQIHWDMLPPKHGT